MLRAMEATYRIISQADGTFAVERTEPGKEPVVTGHFKTEAEARRDDEFNAATICFLSQAGGARS